MAQGISASPGAAVRQGGALGRGGDPRGRQGFQGPPHAGPQGNQPGRRGRHAPGARHPHLDRRQGEPRGGRRPGLGQAVRRRLRGHQDRRGRRDHHGQGPDDQVRRLCDHRRLDGRGLGRRDAHHRSRHPRRILHPDGVGRQGPHPEGPHQRRHPEGFRQGPRVRRRGDRALPDRAHVLRRAADRRHAEDDPGRRRRSGARPPSPSSSHSSARISSGSSRRWTGCR